MKIRVIMHEQDDPRKCTAARLVRTGLARRVRMATGSTVVLDPFAPRVLLRRDGRRAASVTAVDCSWRLAAGVLAGGGGSGRGRGQAGAGAGACARRQLPPLLAGNPVNYSRVGMLTTAEALAGALYITGFDGKARDLLAKFSWGHTFVDLNGALLEDYSKARDADAIASIASAYGLPQNRLYSRERARFRRRDGD